ncbi:MAG: NIL domain-containing protein [Candidatus Omnitrophota bacterium]
MISKRVVLQFPPKLVDQPIVYKLVKEYDLVFNILRAWVTPQEKGELVMELRGEQNNYDNAVLYLKELGVSVEPLSKEITRDEDRCTHCGACITICPTGALVRDDATMKIAFDPEKCIACELCVKGCPPRAMKIEI